MLGVFCSFITLVPFAVISSAQASLDLFNVSSKLIQLS